MDGKRILVTGGAGFIGSNLANALAGDNDVVAIDDESLGDRANLEDPVTFLPLSVLDDDLPTAADVVFHLAALSSYPMHEQDRCRGARVNVEGFVNTVEQAMDAGCETIVYASTSSIYGDCTAPTPEIPAVEARTGYEASKLARERYAEYFRHHYGLDLAGLRLFSVYQGYAAGEGHKGKYANVIAQFADDIADGRSPVLYGDGTQTRDFVYVDDVVEAFVAAATVGLDGTYNVGTGRATSFNEIVDRLNRLLGQSVEPTYVDNPIPDHVYVHDTMADATAFREATGWTPRIDLDTGLARVCAPYGARTEAQ